MAHVLADGGGSERSSSQRKQKVHLIHCSYIVSSVVVACHVTEVPSAVRGHWLYGRARAPLPGY